MTGPAQSANAVV